MVNKPVIPIVDLRQTESSPRVASLGAFSELAAPSSGEASPPHDLLGRPLRDLRISVTDRCNFRCSYCMPKQVFDKHYEFLPHSELLSFEEITRLARSFVALGVEKIRLTGGEPLLRKHVDRLIAMLAELRTPAGRPLDLTLTTNGSLLERMAERLKQAGLRRVTVSLDGLDDAIFQRMNDVGFPVASVLAGIAAAQAAGLGPIKVNMVVKKGVNDSQILPMAQHFLGSGVQLRFIEYMDVGASNGWRMDEVLPSAQLLERLGEQFDLQPLSASAPGETAQRWRISRQGLSSEIGLISSVSRAFCGDCNRARLSTEGKLYTCLFAHRGQDLRSLLRSPATDAQIEATVAGLWSQRSDRYSQLRSQGLGEPPVGERRIEMHYIGG
ncbi:GTP 3',8-cyclase MoaA [Paucibacter sp. DJ2R-2]|uniref:GTP 3',8-cyclase MoaA n=1 Tax=Paucibacter sp. DJ2R-2 TaxID=2893558 RepID=UPI0021E4DEE9|nr:GTP 3',8-cyclase MoaA [Paucibacter sp. DJ2R-2]MCV2422457.1 GTP 3',8-cyclase MoaA [Paucibacter sp. DJ4R-1]MCV2440391.1 GTP 3',8-cyclase MoaA [Paucibacter sp. DJ2R-2]